MEAGLASVRVSGVRPYAAKRNLSRSETVHLTVPTMRLGYSVTPAFSLGLSYCRYADLDSSGLAGSSDIFNEGGPALTVMTPVRGSEDINEFALDGRYRFPVAGKIGFEIGPVASAFHSLARIGAAPSSAGAVPIVTAAATDAASLNNRIFTATDFRLGGVAVLTMVFPNHWRLNGSYRYAVPPGRRLHLYGLTLGYGF